MTSVTNAAPLQEYKYNLNEVPILTVELIYLCSIIRR